MHKKSTAIDLGKGYPSDSLLPLAAMERAWQLMQQRGELQPFLQYGAPRGDEKLLSVLAQFLSRHYRLPVSPEQLLLTAGASQALELICLLCTEPGDTIFIEDPTYFLVFDIFANHKLNVVTVATDEYGLCIESMEEKLLQHKPVFVYTIPTFHNPLGVTLSSQRRNRLIELSEKYGFLVVADEVYHLLNYSQSALSPLMNYDRGTVLSIGSFTKILAPGLRLGWIHSSPEWIEKLSCHGVLRSGGGYNRFASGIVRSVIESQLLDQHLERLQNVYRERATSLSAAVQKFLPQTTFSRPEGGYFVWLRLPEHCDTAKLLEKTRQEILYKPGILFSYRQNFANCLRLSFSYNEVQELEEAVSRLAKFSK